MLKGHPVFACILTTVLHFCPIEAEGEFAGGQYMALMTAKDGDDEERDMVMAIDEWQRDGWR